MKKKTKIAASELIKIALAFIMIFPVIIAVVVSFQTMDEIYRLPYQLTLENPSWDNYIYAFENMNLFVYLKNTLVQILMRVPCQIITSLLAAYAFSYFEFPFKNTLFAIMIAAMMIPGEAVTITVFKMVVKWQLVDTYWGLSITGLVSVGAAFMFRQAMLSVPRSLWEAARMDGCGRMQYFARILVPVCKSIIVSQTILSLIGTYNDYMWPLLVTTRDAMRTVQTGIVYLTGVANTGYTMAAVLIVLMLPLLLFVFGLDYIMEGVTAGAVKS
ncbi:MAG: carbohydrate ABC transporter permease [Tyzzerella sp.]|nr:carbohydrate ABC transporter permease [Tyzzerella sp.]